MSHPLFRVFIREINGEEARTYLKITVSAWRG